MARAGLTDLSSPHTYFVMFLLGRSISVVLAVATIYLVYLCGRTLHGSRVAGITGALLVASMPPLVALAHPIRPDTPYRGPLRLCADGSVGDLHQGSGVRLLRPPGRPYPLAAMAPDRNRVWLPAVERPPTARGLLLVGTDVRVGAQPPVQLRGLRGTCGDHPGARKLPAHGTRAPWVAMSSWPVMRSGNWDGRWAGRRTRSASEA